MPLLRPTGPDTITLLDAKIGLLMLVVLLPKTVRPLLRPDIPSTTMMPAFPCKVVPLQFA